MTYLDVRKTALSPEGHMLLGAMLFEAVQRFDQVEAVAGVVLGGCPLASAVSMFSAFMGTFGGPRPLPALYVRKEAKGHGSQSLVEGIYEDGLQVALVEDVVTTGGSSLQALQTLRTSGLIVRGVVTVVDREEGGGDAFSRVGVPFIALTTLKEVIG
jgi:orotate phosphoribosyltransferase